VKYGGTTLYSHDGDVCNAADVNLPLNVGVIHVSGLGCPANPGPAEFDLAVTLPTIAPSGNYQITLSSKDQDNGDLFCIEADITL